MGKKRDKVVRGAGKNRPVLRTPPSGLFSRLHAFFQTHVDNYETTPGKIFESSMFLLNFAAIILFVIDTYHLDEQSRATLHTAELILVCFFIGEYLVRLWAAEHKLKHAFGIYSIIDLASILPILAAFTDLGFLRIIRILRLVRLVRVLRFQRAFQGKNTLFGRVTETDLIVIRIALTIFTLIFVSSGLTWAIESIVQPEKIQTIWDAMYFTIITITTVGYGDISPVTPIGRLVTILTVLAGITLIPWQLGKLLKVIITSNTKKKVKCSKCGLEDHDQDAIHCKACGTIIKQKHEED